MLTRKHLISAARKVFAKNGFEQASIEDIAAKAGKTRGAFYDNFQDKEDVFFAIFEEDLLQDQKKMGPVLKKARTTDQRIEALTHHLANLLQDKQRRLLNLEFKMYAIRRGTRTRRLAELHEAICFRCCLTEIDQFLPEFADATRTRKRKVLMQLSVLLDGLSLNGMFDPSTVNETESLRHLRTAVREAISEVEARPKRDQLN